MSKDKTGGSKWFDRFLGLEGKGGGMFKDIAQKLRGQDAEAYYLAVGRTLRRIEPAFVPYGLVLRSEYPFSHGSHFAVVKQQYSTKSADRLLEAVPLLDARYTYTPGLDYQLVFVRGDELGTDDFATAEIRADQIAANSSFVEVLPSLVLPMIMENVLSLAKTKLLVLMHVRIGSERLVIHRQGMVTTKAVYPKSPFDTAVSDMAFVFMDPMPSGSDPRREGNRLQISGRLKEKI